MHRHELSDAEWKRVERLLPVRTGPVSKRGDRDFVNAVIWRARTGVAWRDLPERFGSWKTVYNRFSLEPRRPAIPGAARTAVARGSARLDSPCRGPPEHTTKQRSRTRQRVRDWFAGRLGARRPRGHRVEGGRLRIAYLVNRYPLTSHSFIRREILAVEAHGVEVLRFSLRPPDQELVSEADRQELARTRAVLDAGITGHAAAGVAVALRNPLALARAFAVAVRLGWRSDRGLLRHLVYLAEACVLARWLRREHADHVHAHFGTNSAAVALLCREVGGPSYSFTVHGPEEFDRPELLRLDEKIRRAAFVVAISTFGRAQLYRWSRFEDWSKVHVVRCGLEQALLEAPRSAVPEAPRLICVARLTEQKGHMLLLEAAETLAGQGLSFEMVLAGDGPLRGAIEDRIARSGLTGRVRVTGWLGAPQVREAILASRAMVLPSFAEGIPVVLMEALALGRPVIATWIAGIPELVEPDASGWLVPAGSPEALVQAMRAALEAPAARLTAMARAGAARVARDHDVRTEAGKLVTLFRIATGSVGPVPKEAAP